MKVLKFGGTSVQNAENISKVIDIIKEKQKDNRLLVVVSALGKVTDGLLKSCKLASENNDEYKSIIENIEKRHIETCRNLIDVYKQSKILAQIKIHFNKINDLLYGIYLLKELSPKSLDNVLSFGERLSALIISESLKDRNIMAEYLDSRELIKTNNEFNNAKVNFDITNKNIKEYFKNKQKIQIAPGFIASSISGETTTMGRGGSDFTSSIYAAALNAKILEIWTDVDGMMTTDPRVVKNAFPIKSISYAEALELSHFGSKVVNPQTIAPALIAKTPIIIKNTFNPKAEGTLISEISEDKSGLIRGISSIDNISLITVQGSGLKGLVGIASRLFQTISDKSINIILITQGSSEHSITFAVSPDDSIIAKQLIETEFELELKLNMIDQIKIESNLSIIAVVGENMKNTPGISARFFSALARNGVSITATAQGASELNISVVIKKKNLKKSLNSIHEEFFLADIKTVNLFIVGIGLVGSTLLEQIDKQKKYFLKNNLIKLRLVGITNSRKYIFNKNGIDSSNWKKILEEKGKKADISKFIDKMKNLNMRNSIFVDNTATKIIPNYYEDILNSSISIVASNKIANSKSIKFYKRLRKISNNYRAKFLYETNVGAGLPIINTLQNLIQSGDKIIKIEAILSGSLNYVFSSISKTKSFSQAVKEAKEIGYTEPDPRLDLSGMDVARKILILSRETGAKLNLEDIEVENCLTPQSQPIENIDELWKSLETYDDKIIEKRRADAAKEEKKLKYVATFENKKALAHIIEVGREHPFYNLKASDNIILFTTNRYKESPLIVKGPGAGADVTAAGVFADIIQLAN